jgi:energy-coupling factor transport system permease protein
VITEFSLPGGSLLHRLDPRAKLAGLAVFVPPFFLSPSPFLPVAYAVGLGFVIAVCLGARELVRSLAAVGPLLLIICILTPAFHRAGAPLWSPFGLTLLTTVGLRESVRLAGRFAGLTLAFYAVFRTLTMDDLVLALRWYGLPFRAALALIAAFRFIPTLFSLYGAVQDAHALRRAGERMPGFFERVLPQLTSVFIQSVRMIPALAMALETRGFGRGTARTEWRFLPGSRRLAVSFLATGILAVVMYAPLVF